MTGPSGFGGSLPARLNDLALLAMMLMLAGILTMAMALQYADSEVPCPLCLLQRVAMFGVCFGLVTHFRRGYCVRTIGLSMLFALFLLIVSVRQTLLDICPLPGRRYVGSEVLGLHMPVWSVLIAAALIAAFALTLAVFGGEGLRHAERPPLLARIAGLSSVYVTLLCGLNLISVILQCGFGACHTAGYKLL